MTNTLDGTILERDAWQLRYLARNEPLWSAVTPKRAYDEARSGRNPDIWNWCQKGWIEWQEPRGYFITAAGRVAVGLPIPA